MPKPQKPMGINLPDPHKPITSSFWKGETFYTIKGSLDDQGWWSDDSEIHADGDIAELLASYGRGPDISSQLLELGMAALTKKEGK